METLFGRHVHVPGIHERNAARRNFSARAAINAPIQGTAADILKRAMIRIPKALEQNKLSGKAKMLVTVHDELLFEVEENVVDQTSKVVKNVMESASFPTLHLSVPLTIDIGIGNSWGDAH